LLMRKGLTELRPLERGAGPGEGPRFSPIYDAVKGVDWLSPMTDETFFPLRCGDLKLENLWVIDAFGRFLQLEADESTTGLQPVLPQRLRGPDGVARLQPRLAQPARLALQWLPAGRWDFARDEEILLRDDEEFNPVCGWILPNFLDRGLMIYDAGGRALGSLQSVSRKSWRDGVGARRPPLESFHWVDIPGSRNFFFGTPPQRITDPLGDQANPHLRAFVTGLLSLSEGSGQAFSNLLDRASEAASPGPGAGGGQSPNLALLIGRPLALVRASLRLELDGHPARAQGWADLETARTGGIEQVKFSVRLGERRKWNDVWLGDDGLAGFFLDRNYHRFYPASDLAGRNDSYSEFGALPVISVEQPLDLTLLMDPSRGVGVASGILPATRFHLPFGDLTETLESKQVVFFTGPVVAAEGGQDMRMPEPSDIYGQWSWTHHPDVQVWREQSIADVQKEQGAFPGPLRIAEGWLKLLTAPLAIRAMTVKGKEPVEEERSAPGEASRPAKFEAASGDTIVLSWSVTGAERIELKQGDVSLFASRRHPLPVQYAVEVRQSAHFTLVATGRADLRQIREILRQKWDLGRSHREVAETLGVGLDTISSVLQRATEAGLDWPTVQALPEAALKALPAGTAQGEITMSKMIVVSIGSGRT
jgi:hypothetical protein